jgi:hypothetical protein
LPSSFSFSVFHFLGSDLLATISDPLSQTFFISVAPISIGASTVSAAISRAASKTFDRGRGVLLRTGHTGSEPPLTLTVDVKVRTGLATSLRAYFSPSGQLLPSTLKTWVPSVVTVKEQPTGHETHKNFLTSLILRHLQLQRF